MDSTTEDTLAKIRQTEMKLNRGQDAKDDMVMTMAPYANWEEMIHPAPMSIALLGQLLLISTENDFTLVTNDAKFEYLHHPNSFRASLVQVSNEGWTAFNAAHTNMDQIRLYTAQVPNHIQSAIKILVGGTNEEVELVLPKILKNIQRIADSCLENAVEVENKFVRVMKVIAEILEACTSARGEYETKLKQTEAAIAVAKEHEKAAREEKENADKMYEEIQGQVKECQQQYKDAIQSMPGGWDLVGMGIVEGIGKTLTQGMQGMMSAMTMVTLRRGNKEKKTDEDGTEKIVTPEPQEGMAEVKILRKIQSLLNCGIGLQKVVSDLGKPRDAKSGGIQGSTVVNILAKSKAELDRLGSDFEDIHNHAVKENASEVADTCSDLIDKVTNWTKQMNRNPKSMEEIQEAVKALEKPTEYLQMFTKMKSGGAPLSSSAPRQTKAESSGDTSTAVGAAVESARFRVSQSSQVLQSTMTHYENANKRVQEANKELGNLLADLAKCDLQKIDFEGIRETLIRGMKALAEVREQWGKLVRFFQMMTNIIKCSLHESLMNFKENADCGRELKLKYTLSDLMRDMIYQQASEANKIAYLVNSLSGTYVEVSNKYLMDRVASLGKLVALDPNKEKHIIQQKQLELNDNVQSTVKAINNLVKDRREEMMDKIQARMERIEKEMKAVLPPPPPGRKEKIKEIQEKAIAEAEAVDADQWC